MNNKKEIDRRRVWLRKIFQLSVSDTVVLCTSLAGGDF